MSTADPAAATAVDERRSLVLLLVAALLLRLWRIGALGLWADEAMVWTAVRGSIPALLRFCATQDASPPLFHLLTWLVLRFGDSEAHLRFVSALASTALVWVTYRLARLWAPRREALLAAALMALSPYQLMYAQEARTYMLVALWTVLALYLFARAVLLERPRAWWPLSAAIALGLWTQSISLLGLGTQGLIAIATARGRRALPRWLLAVGAGLLAYAPWLLISVRQADHLGDSHWYVNAPDGRGVFQVLRALVLSPVPLVSPGADAAAPGLDRLLPAPLAQALLLALALVPLAAGAWAARRGDARGEGARFALVALLAPLAAVLLVSIRTPLWLVRYFVFLTPFVVLLTASGLATLRPPALARVWGALVLAVAAYGCVRVQWDHTKERWREVTAAVARRAQPGHSAVMVPFDSDPFEYYDRRLAAPLPVIEVSHPEVPFNSRWTPRQLAEMERNARSRVASYDDVWIVVRDASSRARREVVAITERIAAEGGRTPVLVERWTSSGGPLTVLRFRREHPPAPTTLRAAP